MNRHEAERWKSTLLDEIFVALAASEQFRDVLIFKGARVLNARLGSGRQSLDLDSNLAIPFVTEYPDRQTQNSILEERMKSSVQRHFERMEPVRYELASLSVKAKPGNGHPRGWDAFEVRFNVKDLTGHSGNLPALAVDVSAPEELLDTSVSPLPVGGHAVAAYTLIRIAGEKMRAFLSSLPAYRRKISSPPRTVRAKDLYDLARIYRRNPLTEVNFWTAAGKEFRVACQSRFIDCLGRETFQEDWGVTQNTYRQATIPDDIPFEEAGATLLAIVTFLEEKRMIPFLCPLPGSTAD